MSKEVKEGKPSRATSATSARPSTQPRGQRSLRIAERQAQAERILSRVTESVARPEWPTLGRAARSSPAPPIARPNGPLLGRMAHCSAKWPIARPNGPFLGQMAHCSAKCPIARPNAPTRGRALPSEAERSAFSCVFPLFFWAVVSRLWGVI